MEEDKKQEQPAKKSNVQTKNNCKTKWVILILILLMLAGIGGTYWFLGKKYSDMKKQKDDQIGQLEQSKKDLEKQLAEAKSSNAQDSEEEVEKPACTSPIVDDVENIEASITSGNTAALEGHMATKVNVILAASEGIGERTPAQAVSDITSFINGAGVWDFDLPEATVDSYSGAFYAQYFPEGAVVGKSASSKVISFSFDCNGKIKTVFLSASADILTQ